MVTTAVNIPAVAAEDLEVLGPFLPLCRQLGRLAMTLAEGSSVDRVEVEFLGRIAERDTRPLTTRGPARACSRTHGGGVNHVNAAASARSAASSRRVETATPRANFTDLVRVTVPLRRRVAARWPGLASGSGTARTCSRRGASASTSSSRTHIALFRYSDVPGMIGRVGTAFGEHGINIASAAVGRQPDGDREQGLAAMVVLTDQPVLDQVVADVLATAEFMTGRSVTVT